MFSRLRARWSLWLAKQRLVEPVWLGAGPLLRLASAEERKSFLELGPDRRPYECLAPLYHAYAKSTTPNYAAFVPALARSRNRRLEGVLDLACGAGTLTVALAAIAYRVVGVDLSEEMLEQARRRCGALTHVRFFQADFRDFRLNERFDAVICGSDSLNYVTEPSELVAVFRSVALHLNPGGFFAFDVVPESTMRVLSGHWLPIRQPNRWCDLFFRYDAKSRIENNLAVFDNGVELHRRVPIEDADVDTAAAATGMIVVDRFTCLGLVERCFYVLCLAEDRVGAKHPEA